MVNNDNNFNHENSKTRKEKKHYSIIFGLSAFHISVINYTSSINSIHEGNRHATFCYFSGLYLYLIPLRV